MLNLPIIIDDEISAALAQKSPVVALESTLIAHGLPYPDNLTVAHDLNQALRSQGAVPAPIAIFDGVIHVGFKSQALERLADPESKIRKVSRRDVAFVLANKESGATTVSATMLLAHQVGIKIFATGGIGGVHRQAEYTMDISADLYELASTPVAVVCAGAKSILDIGKTLEMLETLGVAVWGYKSAFFPEFFCAGKKYALAMSFENIEKIASALAMHWRLGLKNGVVIAQNCPPSYALKPKNLEIYIQEALIKAEHMQVHGKDLTPFLLSEVALKSQGQSLRCNRALLVENALLAAQIAKFMSSEV